MATEGNVKRQSLVSIDSGVSVVSLEVESRDSSAVADDASSLISANSSSLLSLPTMKNSPSLHSLDSQEGTDSVLECPREQLLAVWPKKCAFIVEEILQTENAYFTSLNEIVKGYMNPLYFVDGLDQVDAVEGIFGNIQDLHQLHERFLMALQVAVTERVEFALAFKEYAEEFQEKYSVYCTQHPKAMQRLQKIMQTKEAVTFFGKCQRSLGHPLPLSSLLLKPVQRVLRYRLLLEKLQDAATKTLQDQQACAAIQDALSEMAKIADEINQRKKEYEILQDVQANLTGWSGGDLAQYGKLLLEDTLKVVGCRSERLVLLLEELLLLLKRKDSKYLYKQHIHVNRMMVQDKGMNGETNAIRVYEQHNLKDMSVLLFSSLERKQEWLVTLTKLILGSISAAKTTEEQRPTVPNPPRRRSKGVAGSPLSKSKRRRYASAIAKVSVAEFLLQMTESPLAARREGGMGNAKGSRSKTKTLPNTGSRESTASPEPPRPRADSWSPEAELPPTSPNSFNPLLDLEDSFESSFEMSQRMHQYPGASDVASHVNLPPSSLERRLTITDVELHLGEDVTYANLLPTSTPIGQRGAVVATSGEVTPTTCSIATSPLTATATAVDAVTKATTAHMQRNTSYLEAVICEKEKEGGYLSTSSGDVFPDDSDTEMTDTDSDEEIVISYGRSPLRVPRSPLVRQKPLDKVHGARVRQRYGSSGSSVHESSEGSVTATDERVTSPEVPNTVYSRTVQITQVPTTSAEMVGARARPNVDVSLSDRKLNDAEEDIVFSWPAPFELERKCIPSVEGTTVRTSKDSSCEGNSEEVAQEGPFPLRRQGSVKKLIANFEKAHASSETAASSQQKKASDASKLTAEVTVSDASSTVQQQAPIPAQPGYQREDLKSESNLTELVADTVEQSVGPKIRPPLWSTQNTDFGSVKVSAVQSRKLQKRKSSERSETEESEYSGDMQGVSVGDDAVLSSPKKAKLSEMALSHPFPLKILQLEDSPKSTAFGPTTHQHSLPIQPSSLWAPSSDQELSVINKPGDQACDNVSAKSPLVDSQSHFLPVRQRAQVLSRMKAGVEPMAHRTESVQVMERQRQGSVSKISNFFEALQEGSSGAAAEGTDSSNTAQEQRTALTDVIGTDSMSTALQSTSQDAPCDDTEVESSRKGLPEAEMFDSDNGVTPIASYQRSTSDGDCHHPASADIDGSSEDTSSSSQVQITLRWSSSVTCQSQSPTLSAGHVVVAGSDSQPPTEPPTDPMREPVELDTEFFVQCSPPPSPGPTSVSSQPELGDVNVEEPPCGHCEGDAHTTSTPQVEDGFHASGTVGHFLLSRATTLYKSVPIMDSPKLSSETSTQPILVHENAVVDAQSQELVSCTEGVPEGSGGSTVTSTREQDGEVSSTQFNLVSCGNMDRDETQQPSSLTSNSQASDIQSSSSEESGMQANDPQGDRQMNHVQTGDAQTQEEDVKLDDKLSVGVTMNEVQTGDAQVEAAQMGDVHVDDVQTDDMQWDDVQTKPVDSNSAMSPVATLLQEDECVQLSTVSAQSAGEAAEEVALVYETTSLVMLPRKHRESHGMIDVQFEDALSGKDEASAGVSTEQECHNVNATPDTVSVADSADKAEIDQSLPHHGDSIQGTLPVSDYIGGVELNTGPNYSGLSHVTNMSTKSCPADCCTQPPVLQSDTCLPPLAISEQRDEKALHDQHLAKDNTVTDTTTPLSMGDSGREGVKKQLIVAVQQTVHAPTLEGSQATLEPADKNEDVLDDSFTTLCDHTHTTATECAEDSPGHAVSEMSTKDSRQSHWQSPVYGNSQLPPSSAVVASGPSDVVSSPADVTSGPVDVSFGPSDIASGSPDVAPSPADVMRGLADAVSSPANVVSGFPDVALGPSDVVSSPVDVTSGPVDVELGPPDVASGPADVASGPVLVDTSALYAVGLPTGSADPYSSHYSGFDSRQDHRWGQSEKWPDSSSWGDGRQGRYHMHGRSSYEYKSPYPVLPPPPTAWDQYSPAQQTGRGDRNAPTHAYYQPYHHGYNHHGNHFGTPRRFEPLQRHNPVAYVPNGDVSYDAEWGTLYHSSDNRLNTGQVQELVPQHQSTDSTVLNTASMLKADNGQVECVGQKYSEVVPVSDSAERDWESGMSGKGTLVSEQSWQRPTSLQVGSTQAQADVTSPMHRHGNDICEASAASATRSHASALDDTNSDTSEGSSRFETQFSIGSLEGKSDWSTCAPSALPVEGESGSAAMSSSLSLNSAEQGEGDINWSLGKEMEGGRLSVPGEGGVASVHPAPQEHDVAAGGSKSGEYLGQRLECDEVALQLETSVWDEGGTNGLSLSPTRIVPPSPPPPVTVTPRRPSRNKPPSSSHMQHSRLGGFHDTDTKSHLPLFHVRRGNSRSKTKLFLFLLFVFLIIFMGLQVFVGEAGWMQPL